MEWLIDQEIWTATATPTAVKSEIPWLVNDLPRFCAIDLFQQLNGADWIGLQFRVLESSLLVDRTDPRSLHDENLA